MYAANWVDMSGYLTLPLDAFTWRAKKPPESLQNVGELVMHWDVDKTVHEAPFWMYATLEAAEAAWTLSWYRSVQAAFLRTGQQTTLRTRIRRVADEIANGKEELVTVCAERVIAATIQKNVKTLEPLSDTAVIGGSVVLAMKVLEQQASIRKTKQTVAEALKETVETISVGLDKIEAVLSHEFCCTILRDNWMPAPARYGASAKPVNPTNILNAARRA